MTTNYQFEIDFCQGVLHRDSQNLEVMEMLAGYYTKSGQINEGLALDRTIVKMKPDCSLSHYNLACSLALKHRNQEAVEALRMAFEKGYDDINWLLSDPDLQGLQDDPSFSALISEHQHES